eukprot:scaffold106197_cov27-Prasinocladus_malaysianus.AAC.1
MGMSVQCLRSAFMGLGNVASSSSSSGVLRPSTMAVVKHIILAPTLCVYFDGVIVRTERLVCIDLAGVIPLACLTSPHATAVFLWLRALTEARHRSGEETHAYLKIAQLHSLFSTPDLDLDLEL